MTARTISVLRNSDGISLPKIDRPRAEAVAELGAPATDIVLERNSWIDIGHASQNPDAVRDRFPIRPFNHRYGEVSLFPNENNHCQPPANDSAVIINAPNTQRITIGIFKIVGAEVSDPAWRLEFHHRFQSSRHGHWTADIRKNAAEEVKAIQIDILCAVFAATLDKLRITSEVDRDKFFAAIEIIDCTSPQLPQAHGTWARLRVPIGFHKNGTVIKPDLITGFLTDQLERGVFGRPRANRAPAGGYPWPSFVPT